MQIEVSRLPLEGTHFTGADTFVVVEPTLDGEVITNGPIAYEVYAQFVDDELIVKGKLAVEVSFRCSRCAELFKKKVVDKAFFAIREVAERNESVDLTEEMREAILCAFPSHPVCAVDCKGLCPKCGANLNKEKCSCRPGRDFRWDALEGLKL